MKKNASKKLKRMFNKAKQRKEMRNISAVGNPADVEQLRRWREKHYVSTTIQGGDHLETIVQRICERIGVPDLVSRGPKFMDGKNENEIADILVLLGKTLIAFQIKHKNLNSEKSEEIILGRAQDLVSKSISQFEKVITLSKKRTFPRVNNLRGNDLELNRIEDLELICISVIAFPGMQHFPEEKKIEVPSRFTLYRNTIVHIVDVDSFDKISIELDTLPDLLDYLQKRKIVIERHLIGDMNELDFLAMYKTKIDDLRDLMAKGDKGKLLLLPDMWDYYVTKLGGSITKRNDLNEVSYIVDRILIGSHRSIGYNAVTPGLLNSSSDPGSIESHLAIATELASIRRLHRRIVGEAIKNCVIRADENLEMKGHFFAFRIANIENNTAVVILAVVASKTTRAERIIFLDNLCKAAYLRMNVKKVIGIATESARAIQRSEDFMLYENIGFNPEEITAIQDFSAKVFGPEKRSTSTEYGG